MKLSKICEEIEYTLLQGSLETEVRDIIYDSRKIAPETMFVCMVGAVTDGHKYIPDAVEKGASVIVLEKEEEAAQIPENITVLKVESARLALALMSAALFDHPARKLVTIGLTGTKGSILSLRSSVNPHNADFLSSGTVQGIDRSQSHIVVIAEDQLNGIRIQLQPLLHQGRGLGALPVGNASGDFFNRDTPVL